MVHKLLLAAALVFGAQTLVMADDEATASEETAAASAPAVEKMDKPGSLKAGKDLMDEGKWAEAAAYFEGIGVQEAANGTQKREPWRLNNLARCYVALEKYDEAAKAAQMGLEIRPDIYALWSNLGAAQSRAGKHDDAIATYKKAIETLEGAGKDTGRIPANLKFLEDAKAGLIDEEGNYIKKEDAKADEAGSEAESKDDAEETDESAE